MKRSYEWIPTLLAAIAFALFAAVFVWEVLSYQKAVIGWARRDLQSRADLAAANLEEPLRTQDFRKIHAFGADCVADGVRLAITGANGGRVFDTQRNPTADLPSYLCTSQSGEYTVTVSVPSARVLAPFTRALAGFALAGLVGIAGVLLFFFVTYRQRVRIRELKRVERFRRDFVADVSHEIKTPLAGIIGAADLLGDDASSPLPALIKREAGRLNRLVQAILDLARLEREGDVLRPADIDLAGLVRDVAHRYEIACTADESAVVRCDPLLIEEAISNLVENARRHSGSTEISISLRRQRDGVLISVEDHGIGIPPEHVPQIFDRFHRVDPARAAETGGAGLGLAIVRQIARLHGGDVTYRPATPHGSVFTLHLASIIRAPRRRGRQA